MTDDAEIIYLHERLSSIGLNDEQIEQVIQIIHDIDDDLDDAEDAADQLIERHYNGDSHD